MALTNIPVGEPSTGILFALERARRGDVAALAQWVRDHRRVDLDELEAEAFARYVTEARVPAPARRPAKLSAQDVGAIMARVRGNARRPADRRVPMKVLLLTLAEAYGVRRRTIETIAAEAAKLTGTRKK